MELSTDTKQPLAGSVSAVRTALLAAILLFLPLEIPQSLVNNGYPTVSIYYRWVLTLLPLDLIWLAFTVLSVPVIARSFRTRRISWGLIAMTIFTGWAVVSLLVNPTLLGATFVARWMGSIAIVAVITEYNREALRRFVAGPLLVSGAIQATIALWQYPGPGRGFSYYAAELTVNRGTYLHQAGLALLLVVVIAVGVATLPSGRARIPWLIGIGLAAAAIAGTLSRTGGLALAVIWAAYVWGVIRDRRAYASALAASVVPFLLTLGLTYAGWVDRVAQTTSGSLNERSSGRITLIQNSGQMIADNPVFGVGPGRYIAELARLHPTWQGWDLMPVHVTPLLAAAELGIIAGSVIAAVLVFYGWRALRTSPAALAVFASIGVFLLIEQRTYYIPADVALFAVWLATLDLLSKPGFRAHPEPRE